MTSAMVIEELGIDFGQGFLLGRPLSVQHWVGTNEGTASRTSVAGLWECTPPGAQS